MRPKPAGITMALRWILVFPVIVYRKLISPLIPSRCIYSPSCSHYTHQAILRHGLRGLLLGIIRVTRCIGGVYTGGDDPVPDEFNLRSAVGSYRDFWNNRSDPQ